MKKFKEVLDDNQRVIALETGLTGKLLLTTPELNKGSAFTHDERQQFNLIGKLPYHVESLDDQVARYYNQYCELPDDLSKNEYLNRLRQHNNVCFFRLVAEHLEEMMPIVYTPTIGDAVKSYSFQFDSPRGLHFSYPEVEGFDQLLNDISYPCVDLVVVSDGEGVLGIGDWGAGGIDICVGKSVVYTLCGGINPRRILPIQIDVGTNNHALLNDPMYLGWRHERLSGDEYHAFIDKVVSAILRKYPNMFIHWEDFGISNAREILARYRGKLCTFNDDVQGTGATALASVLSGLKVTGGKLSEQRFVIFGAGSAGVGVADQLVYALKEEGLSDEEAHACFWLIDRPGLLREEMDELRSFQKPYARPASEFDDLPDGASLSLLDVVERVHPTVLIGCSAVAGAFTQEVVTTMAQHVDRPIIFPLSNPTSRAEATPQDLVDWTEGRAIVAAGSPFGDVTYNGKTKPVSQCNNAFVFPGLGLGVLACGATRITDYMITQAAHALAECSPLINDPSASLLPPFSQAQTVSKYVALAVARAAEHEGVARMSGEVDYQLRIESIFWEPEYLPFRENPDLLNES